MDIEMEGEEEEEKDVPMANGHWDGGGRKRRKTFLWLMDIEMEEEEEDVLMANGHWDGGWWRRGMPSNTSRETVEQ